MKFKVQVADLNEALDVVSIVPPKPLTGQGGVFYLFVVRDGTCFLYSVGDTRLYSRACLKISDIEGEGSFLYPAGQIGAMQYLDGWVQIESGKDDDSDRYWVRFLSEGGANGEESTIAPDNSHTCDEFIDEARKRLFYEYPVTLLREGIGVARTHLPKAGDTKIEEYFRTIQVFDKSKKEWEKGNGCLFTADSTTACYFYSKEFENKGLSIHANNLPFVLGFLGKCSGKVRILMGESATFAETEDGSRIIGWVHQVQTHGQYKYYPPKWDKHVLRGPRDILAKALKFVQSSLEAKKDKIRVIYDHTASTIMFQAGRPSGKVSSRPIGVVPVELKEEESGANGATTSFAVNANVYQLLNMIEPMKSPEVFLRIAIVPGENGRKESALFRTIEEFWIDANGKVLVSREDAKGEPVQCKVTRFMPSKD
jgi:hypothetical protein